MSLLLLKSYINGLIELQLIVFLIDVLISVMTNHPDGDKCKWTEWINLIESSLIELIAE